MSIMKKLDALWDAVTEWFENIGEDILDFVAPLAKEIAKNGGKLLLEVAREAVLLAEATGGSGRDKFEAAQAHIKTALEARGIPVVLNAVNGAIEAAVARLHNEAA